MIQDLQQQASHSPGLIICGLPPKKRIACLIYVNCEYCKRTRRHIRLSSGSGWYEDEIHCLTCGEDYCSGYRPFERAWRKRAVTQARSYLRFVVDRATFHEMTMASIKNEMGWDDRD